jgi:hypothetical protein
MRTCNQEDNDNDNEMPQFLSLYTKYAVRTIVVVVVVVAAGGTRVGQNRSSRQREM